MKEYRESISMGDIIFAETLKQLGMFANDKNIIEIVVRDSKKRIKAFQKVVLNDLPETQQKEAVNKVIGSLNRNIRLTERNLLLNSRNTVMLEKTTALLSKMSKLQGLGLAFSGANLVATCAGFAIMYKKLDSINKEIDRQFVEANKNLKQGTEIWQSFEFDKVLSDYSNMLDCRRKRKPYSEDAMRKLVDHECNVLNMLIRLYEKDHYVDQDNLVVSIFSLLGMFSKSIQYLDEIYYENNSEVIDDDLICHSSHDRWMNVFDELSQQWFIDKLQDHATFDLDLDIEETDAYYISMMDQIFEKKQEIEDNLDLIHALGKVDLLRNVRETNIKELQEEMDRAFAEAFQEMNDPTMDQSIQQAMKQVMSMN